jgi:hypothetical protein
VNCLPRFFFPYDCKVTRPGDCRRGGSDMGDLQGIAAHVILHLMSHGESDMRGMSSGRSFQLFRSAPPHVVQRETNGAAENPLESHSDDRTRPIYIRVKVWEESVCVFVCSRCT